MRHRDVAFELLSIRLEVRQLLATDRQGGVDL
jgi:hypothetical protein